VKALASDLLARIPGPPTGKYPRGAPFAVAFRHGTMLVELFAPRGADTQSPHAQDELYFVHAGTGTFACGGERHAFAPGTCFFVPAGVEHRFESFSPDFATWVVFWGPPGGEASMEGGAP
jgi:mannose-6-phosphate isomerase-like protein (cupin superfamily)